MSRRTLFFVVPLLVLVVSSLTIFTVSKASTNSAVQAGQSDGGQPMQELVSEIRQLRLAIQKTNLSTYHAQITIERMKLQQQRVYSLDAQLGAIRNQLASTRKILSQLSAQLKSCEEVHARETDAAARTVREGEIRGIKAELEEMIQKEQQQQEAETQLNTQFMLAQATLADLNERLDALQRELETHMTADKPQQQSGKRPENN
jgi:chromosome segregation ATPase